MQSAALLEHGSPRVFSYLLLVITKNGRNECTLRGLMNAAGHDLADRSPSKRCRLRNRKETYKEFEARIWDTVLPNGVRLRDATGSDMAHAARWFEALADRMANWDETARKKKRTRSKMLDDD